MTLVLAAAEHGLYFRSSSTRRKTLSSLPRPWAAVSKPPQCLATAAAEGTPSLRWETERISQGNRAPTRPEAAATPRPAPRRPLANKEQVSGLISKWLFPGPRCSPSGTRGQTNRQAATNALDELISHFLGISILVLTGGILLASFIGLLLTHSLRGIVAALQSITEVVHDIRENRHFSRRVPEERIEEFHLFARDFNSLLGDGDWQRQLQGQKCSAIAQLVTIR